MIPFYPISNLRLGGGVGEMRERGGCVSYRIVIIRCFVRFCAPPSFPFYPSLHIQVRREGAKRTVRYPCPFHAALVYIRQKTPDNTQSQLLRVKTVVACVRACSVPIAASFFFCNRLSPFCPSLPFPFPSHGSSAVMKRSS